MSFISNAFGAQNSYTPAGQPMNIAQTSTANQNYGVANTGLVNLSEALQNQMNGGGPNVANAQLQQATAQNVNDQASLAAGQRGAAQNVGLIARQAANVGANAQQQAAGQSATNVLQQQISAQQQLAGVLGTQGQLANANYGVAQGGVSNDNTVGAGVAGQNAATNAGLINNVMNTGSKAAKLGGGAPMANGGPVQGQPAPMDFSSAFVSGVRPTMMASGGSVHLPFAPMDYRGGGTVRAQAPQQKAQVPGNSLENDKIPIMASEGEIVLPRTVTQSPNAPQLAAQLVSQVMQGKHKGGKK